MIFSAICSDHVTIKPDESLPCSHSIRMSRAASAGSIVSSTKIITSLGPAGNRELI